MFVPDSQAPPFFYFFLLPRAQRNITPSRSNVHTQHNTKVKIGLFVSVLAFACSFWLPCHLLWFLILLCFLPNTVETKTLSLGITLFNCVSRKTLDICPSSQKKGNSNSTIELNFSPGHSVWLSIARFHPRTLLSCILYLGQPFLILLTDSSQ